ncbi:MAG: DUF1919 domain-containing protein [Oscillospiraceae bacterium]|nr:DUF1919 domain-containing protein [Oscillospiraceae bacterium]
MRVKKLIKETAKELLRMPLKHSMRRRLKVNNARIIASMCAGGILSHDLGLQFLSPTINLIIPEFTAFCDGLEDRLRGELVDKGTSPHGYPLAELDGFLIEGVHYHSFDQLNEQWRRRTQRFFASTDEIVLIASDTQVHLPRDVEAFHALPYRKVCFTSRQDIPYEEFIYCPEFAGEDTVGDILRYTDLLGTRIFEKRLDCVGWLNGDVKG